MAKTLMSDGEQTQVADTEKEQASIADEKQNESEVEQPTDGDNGDAPKEGDEQSESGAPESYDFKQEEGKEIDPSVIDAYSEAAKDLNMSQGDAQKMLDSMSPIMAQRQQEQVEAVQQAWADESKADKEFGGESLNENLATAKKAMDAFGTPELTTLLNETGLGNHPEIIRAFYRAGMKISEDTFIGGGNAPNNDSQTTAQRMYPDMNP